jgi:DNA-binding transcriptional LysR family regulator
MASGHYRIPASRKERMVLACGPTHPLRDRDAIDLRELRDEAFVDFYPGWVTRDVVDQAMAPVASNGGWRSRSTTCIGFSTSSGTGWA